MLRADVGPEPGLPPLNGWKFLQYDQSDRLKYLEDVNLTCRAPAASPSCTLKVSLSGLAKEALGRCEGSYKTTRLTSMGRQVNNDLADSTWSTPNETQDWPPQDCLHGEPSGNPEIDFKPDLPKSQVIARQSPSNHVWGAYPFPIPPYNLHVWVKRLCRLNKKVTKQL